MLNGIWGEHVLNLGMKELHKCEKNFTASDIQKIFVHIKSLIFQNFSFSHSKSGYGLFIYHFAGDLSRNN